MSTETLATIIATAALVLIVGVLFLARGDINRPEIAHVQSFTK
jgi:hypothetical protein